MVGEELGRILTIKEKDVSITVQLCQTVRERESNLTKVRPLFTLSHRGSDNSPLLIVLTANYIDQSNRDFYATVFRRL